jgi:enoyl-CoA hydratase/carnithine racemase
MAEPILLEVDTASGVATLTLNRPERRNAFDVELVDSWAAGLADLASDERVGAIVVTGAGTAFCAGGDLATLAEDAAPLARKQFLRDHVHRVARTLANVEQPVIAMVNGAAMGAGLDMALLCDLRIAAADAKLGEAYVNVGLVPGDGGAWLLPRLVGPARALELLWTGRVLTGAEAAEWGLVNRAVPAERLGDETYQLAGSLAAGPRLAISLIKRAVYAGMAQDLASHLDMISSYMALAQADEAFTAAVAKLRPPGTDRGR